MTMRWIGGVQGYSFKIFNPYVIRARSNSQILQKFINFGLLGLDHNLSISLILTISYEIDIEVTYPVIKSNPNLRLSLLIFTFF